MEILEVEEELEELGRMLYLKLVWEFRAVCVLRIGYMRVQNCVRDIRLRKKRACDVM